MTKTEFYRSIGICPYCRKRKISDGAKRCIECKQLWDEYAKKRYKKKYEEIKAYNRILQKRLKDKRIENGECSRCGKKLTDADTDFGYQNYKMCIACRQYYQSRRKGK